MDDKSRVPAFYQMLVSFLALFGWGREDAVRDGGQINIGQVVGIVISAIVLVVVVFLYSGLAEPIFNATENMTLAFETGSTGNSTIDTVLPFLGMLVAAVIPLGLLAAVISAVQKQL